MSKRYQITLSDNEAKRINKLSKRRGVPIATVIRELALWSLKEFENFWMR